MADEFIKVEIQGMDRLQKALDQFPRKVEAYMQRAGYDASKEIMKVKGLSIPPPTGKGNRPPTPYWEREKGMWRGGTRKPKYNDLSSRKALDSWTTKAQGYNTTIGNSATPYNVYLYDEQKQSQVMAAIGWRKLIDVVREKMSTIKSIYQKYVSQLLKDLGL